VRSSEPCKAAHSREEFFFHRELQTPGDFELSGTWMTRRELLSLLFSLGAREFGRVLHAQETKPKSDPVFQVKSPKGVDFVLRNSPTSRKYLIETMPGGVALLDYNNDGLLDVFFVNGGNVRDTMAVPVNFDRRNPAYWNRLYIRIPMAASPMSPSRLASLMLAIQTTGWEWPSGITTMTAFPIFT
jgi:hypothetical protein